MNKEKTSPIVIIAFFPFFILKYAYIGILAIFGLNKKRHEKDTKMATTNNQEQPQSNSTLPTAVVPTIAVTKEEPKIIKEQNTDELKDIKEIKQKESLTGKTKTNYGFRYTIRLNNGKLYQNTFDAPSIEEAERFLKNEGYEVVKIVPRTKLDIDLPYKLKESALAFDLTQISTYLKSGIALVDAIRIVSKQTQNKQEKTIWDKIVYALLSGKNFSEALEEQSNVFPAMLTNMVRTAEMTGALTEILDDMADYYEKTSQTKKEMISAMIYPGVVFTIAVIVSLFMFLVIVPQFAGMLKEENQKLPWYTNAVLNVSEFMTAPTFHPDERNKEVTPVQEDDVGSLNEEDLGTETDTNVLDNNNNDSDSEFRIRNYMVIFVIILILLVVYRALFKNIKSFKRTMQSIYMKLPVFGKIIVYNEVIIFTKTFASLINHGVKIADSMEILGRVTDNELFKELIQETLDNIVKGKNVSDAFKGSSFFPVVAYEMLVTGENTGRLGDMMEKVSVHFTNLHKNLIDQMKSLIEPIMIVFLGGMIGAIIISILGPMLQLTTSYS